MEKLAIVILLSVFSFMSYGQTNGNKQNNTSKDGVTDSIVWTLLIKPHIVYSSETVSDSAAAYYKKGTEKFYSEDYKGAIEDYSKAIEFNFNYMAAYTNRGISKGEFGDYKGAIGDYDKVISLDPDDAFVYCYRGAAKSRLGEMEGAVADFDKALTIDPEHTLAYLNRGTIKYVAGDYEGALTDYSKAIEIRPNAIFHLVRAAVKHEMGDYEGEIADYRQSFIYSTPNAELYNRLGRALYEQKQYEDALKVYDEGISVYPTDHDLYYGLEQACNQLNDKDKTANTVADTITFKIKSSLYLMATPGFEFIVSDGSRTEKKTGKGFAAGDSIKYEFSTNEERTVTIIGAVGNLLFASATNNLSYRNYLRKQGRRKTLVVFAEGVLQLNISKNKSLRQVLCRECRLSELDVTHNHDLEELDCSENQLKSLDISRNKNLRVLFCTKNKLMNIDVSHNLLLEELICFDNDNLSLDVSANKNLKFLSCDGLLKEIDLTNNTELKELICRCKLTKLNLSKNKKLKKLRIDGNNLSAEELNSIFKVLPTVDYYKDHTKIDFSDNPGTSDCDRSILEEKGWLSPNNNM